MEIRPRIRLSPARAQQVIFHCSASTKTGSASSQEGLFLELCVANLILPAQARA